MGLLAELIKQESKTQKKHTQKFCYPLTTINIYGEFCVDCCCLTYKDAERRKKILDKQGRTAKIECSMLY